MPCSGGNVGGVDGPRCSPGIDDPIPGRRRPDFRPAKTRLRPPSPGRPKSCRGCRGTSPGVLLLSMTRFQASGDPSPAGEDPSPATVAGPPAGLSGAPGLLLRGEGVAFICRARAEVRHPRRAPHRGWRPGRSGRCLLELASWRPGWHAGRGAPWSGIARRAVAGVGVALNCRACAPASALPAIPDVMAWRPCCRVLACGFRAEAPGVLLPSMTTRFRSLPP